MVTSLLELFSKRLGTRVMIYSKHRENREFIYYYITIDYMIPWCGWGIFIGLLPPMWRGCEQGGGMSYGDESSMREINSSKTGSRLRECL